MTAENKLDELIAEQKRTNELLEALLKLANAVTAAGDAVAMRVSQ
jgi:hypothetical protein